MSCTMASHPLGSGVGRELLIVGQAGFETDVFDQPSDMPVGQSLGHPKIPQEVRKGGWASALDCSETAPSLYSSPIRIMREGYMMGRIKVNLTLDAEVARDARALGLNMSRLAEAAITEAAKAERNSRWREENRDAIAAYAEEVARNGLPLARFRSF